MKILFVGPHPDDNELHCGGLALKLLANGHEVQFLSVCNGDGGHQTLPPEQIAARRAGEINAVAEYLGIRYDVWSDIHDCSVMADLPTRRRMIRYIRSFNPDIVITNRTNDYHADHRNAGILVQDASYLLTVPNECPDVPAMRYMPVIMYSEDCFTMPPYQAHLIIPIDDVVEKKYEMLDKHVSQMYEWLPYTRGQEVPEGDAERFEWLKADSDSRRAIGFCKTADRYRDLLIQQYGEKGKEVRHAEVFQVCEYGKPMSEELRQTLINL